MKKNLLMLLFTVALGVVPALADMVRIQVDNAANIVVTTGNGANTLTLQDGMNSFDLDASQSPLAIGPAAGAEIVDMTKNGEVIQHEGDGTKDDPDVKNYFGDIYRCSIEPMMIMITTRGVSQEFNTYVMANYMNAASITCNGEKTIVTENAYLKYPAGSELLIAAEEGYKVTNVSYQDAMWQEIAVDNGDGTWSVTPNKDYGSLNITLEEKGIHFLVDINAPTNVSVIATLKEAVEGTGGQDAQPAVTKSVELSGSGPYSCTAPEGTLYLNFWPAGDAISAVTRVDEGGVPTDLVYSDWVGWRSTVTEGDTFVIDATGSQIDMKFAGARGLAADNYVINDASGKVTLTEKNGAMVGKVRVGENIVIAGANGTNLTGIFADPSNAIQVVSDKMNGMITAKVLETGTITMYGTKKTGMQINVDNAAAVTVTGGAGNGAVVELANGVNEISTVQNPLKIEATAGYRITAVCAGGELLNPNADGSYNAELIADGTVIIETAELPKPLPISFSVTGDSSKLIITKDGESVPFEELMAVTPGTEITVGVQEGWLIKSFVLTNGVQATLDEETGVYTFYPRKATNVLINVEEWVAAEGNALVRYNTDMERVSALVFNADGERDGSLKIGLNEVKIGNSVKIMIFGDRYLNAVKVNGKDVELAEDKKSATFVIEGETTIDVTTYELCYVSGYKTSNPQNHSFLGYIYINEVGQLTANVATGATFTVLPTPERGYKFTGFDYIYPDVIKEQIGDEIKDSYTVTVPDGVTDIVFRGTFELSGQEQLYTIRGGNTFLNTIENITNDAMVWIDDNGAYVGEYNAFEGETVHLVTSANSPDFRVVSYCLYDSQKPISADYVVDGQDADSMGVITVSAFVTKDSGVEGIAAEGSLSYDSESKVLTSQADVKIFTMAGMLVNTVEAGENSLETLAPGIYIVTDGVNTIKIVR